MRNIYDYTLKELEDYFVNLGDKKFRAVQIYDFLYKKRINELDKFSNISKVIKEHLKDNFSFEKIGSGETKETQHEPKKDKAFVDLLIEGYADYKSVNFQYVIIAGAKAQEAAQWITENLDNEFDETQEIMLLIAANRQFGVNCKPIAEGKTFRMV